MLKTELYLRSKNLYKQGYSINQVHDITGVNKKNFGLYLKKNGIEIRNGFTKTDIKVNESYFETIDTAEKAYWLGFIYADGSVVNKHRCNRLTIELSTVDYKHLEKFNTCIQTNAEIKLRKNRPICSVTINRKKIAEDLTRYGCIPNKTENGNMDPLTVQGYEADFLRGYLDGDGYIEKNYKKYRIVFTVKSPWITQTLMQMLQDFKPRLEELDSFNRIHIEKKEIFFSFLQTLYGNAEIYLDRKYYTAMSRISAHPDTTLQKVWGK